MGGAVVTEGIFSVPGIGREIYRAIIQQQPSVVLGIVTLLVLVFLVRQPDRRHHVRRSRPEDPL